MASDGLTLGPRRAVPAATVEFGQHFLIFELGQIEVRNSLFLHAAIS
jgi:hypothetical protein